MLNRVVELAVTFDGTYSQFWRLHKNRDEMSVMASTKRGYGPDHIDRDVATVRVVGLSHWEALWHGGVPFVGPASELFDRSMWSRIEPGGSRFVIASPVRRRQAVYGALLLYTLVPASPEQIWRTDNLAQLVEDVVECRRLGRSLNGEAVALIAEERFRREISEELHGPIQTKLFLAVNVLKSLPAETTQWDDMHRKIQSVVEDLERLQRNDIRFLSHRLHPGIIRVALRPALGLLERQFANSADVSFVISRRVEDLDTPVQNGISERTRLTVYRVVEEAILNAIKHGGAQEVRVEMDIIDDKLLQVTVTDDGSGFAPGIMPGLGIQLMRARVHSVYGDLSIRRVVQGGTEVKVCIPLRIQYTAQRPLAFKKPHHVCSEIPLR